MNEASNILVFKVPHKSKTYEAGKELKCCKESGAVFLGDKMAHKSDKFKVECDIGPFEVLYSLFEDERKFSLEHSCENEAYLLRRSQLVSMLKEIARKLNQSKESIE